MTALDDAGERHIGVLQESGYSFWCWTVCSCGWRSKSYRRSAQAWAAHTEHSDPFYD